MKALLPPTPIRLVIIALSFGLLGMMPLLAAEPDGEWVPLFNGKDLDGWTPKIRGHEAGVNFADTFRVEDGLLKVRYDGYGGQFNNRFGHLFFNAPFSHYKLRVEYRFVDEQLPDGPGWAWRNSGIMIHGQTPESMALDQDFPVSIEVQLLGGGETGNRPTANLCTPGTHVVLGGNLHTQHCTNSKSGTYRGDQWVTVELEVRGNGSIWHFVDGIVVLEYSEPQLDPGDAAARRLIEAGAPLQLKGGTLSLQSESHPVDFRKVELLKLAEPVSGSRDDLLDTLDMAAGDAHQVKTCLNLGIKDSEDALQIAAAMDWKASFIVTGNVRDFKRLPIPALAPAAWIKRFQPDFGN